jgi:hypothetical protein
MGPDIYDVETIVRGAKHRMNRLTPKVEGFTRRRQFRNHVRLMLRTHFKPLAVDSDTRFETWISHTSYPKWRVEQLEKAKPTDIYRNKSFIKREFYPEPKHARWINSRSDYFKKVTGPIFHLIESEVFKNKHFIKRIPVSDRSKYLHDYLYHPGSQYLATDHTSYEAHLTPEIMKICEMQLYSYMTRNLRERGTFLDHLANGLLSKQRCNIRNSKANVYAETYARMSGDMCTSLGNGFTNWMVMSFVAKQLGWRTCEGVVEGDDGIFRVDGKVPSSQDFSRLGFTIKSELSNSLGEVGFCQLYNTDDRLENLLEPQKVILRAGWTMSSAMHGGEKVRKQLTKAKAYSLLCEAPTNPITGKMALWLLRVTRDTHKLRWDENEEWWSNQVMSTNVGLCIRKALEGPSDSQRHFVANKWNIPVGDQIKIEQYFDQKKDLSIIDDPLLISHISNRWSIWSYLNNVRRVEIGESWSVGIN